MNAFVFQLVCCENSIVFGILTTIYIYLMETYSINKDHYLSDYKEEFEFLESEFWVISVHKSLMALRHLFTTIIWYFYIKFGETNPFEISWNHYVNLCQNFTIHKQ